MTVTSTITFTNERRKKLEELKKKYECTNISDVIGILIDEDNIMEEEFKARKEEEKT